MCTHTGTAGSHPDTDTHARSRAWGGGGAEPLWRTFTETSRPGDTTGLPPSPGRKQVPRTGLHPSQAPLSLLRCLPPSHTLWREEKGPWRGNGVPPTPPPAVLTPAEETMKSGMRPVYSRPIPRLSSSRRNDPGDNHPATAIDTGCGYHGAALCGGLRVACVCVVCL